MMDMHRCIGCRYCIAACPFGARSFNWRDPRPYIDDVRLEFAARTKGVVEKCNFCAELIRDWERRVKENPELREEEPEPVPVCVAKAKEITGDGTPALTFGDLSDDKSAISLLLAEKHTICRRAGLGTGPNVFYIV